MMLRIGIENQAFFVTWLEAEQVWDMRRQEPFPNAVHRESLNKVLLIVSEQFLQRGWRLSVPECLNYLTTGHHRLLTPEQILA